MTQPNCPLHQPRCGLQEGNPVCPKCGLDVRVRFVSEEAAEAARKTALAAWTVADQAETAQSEAPPTPTTPKPEGESAQSQSPEPKPPVPPIPEAPIPPRNGAKHLIGAVVAVLLVGGGYMYWQQQKALQLALEQQQQMQQAQEREKEQAKQTAQVQEQQVRQAREQTQAAEQSKQAAQAALEKQQAQIALERQKEQAKLALKAEPAPTQIAAPSATRCTDCPEMVVVPGGSFQMGSNDSDSYKEEKVVHRVSIKRFAIGKYEVTQGQWRALMGSNPSLFDKCGDNCPVEQVSWDDIQSYIQKLNQKTGQQYRLPSEAEWEYACRGGQQHKYCGSDEVGSVAWYDTNSKNTTHQIGQLTPNGYGLHDMSGNVWEWVQDWYHDSYNAAPNDGSAWVTGGEQKNRVLRGGSCGYDARNSRSAVRASSAPGSRIVSIGFRLARTAL